MKEQLLFARAFLRTFALIGLFAAPALAVCPQPEPRVCAEFFKSDAVFVGIVLGELTLPEPHDFIAGWIYELRVQRVFRGPRRKTVKVFTENASARFPLELGREYLLFATKYKNRLEITNCGNSALLSQAEHTIRQIEQIKKTARGGEIVGRVVSLSSGPPLAGIRIVVRGHNKTYATVTDQDGNFYIHVPPGKYTAHAESSAWIVSPYDLSYDDPNQIVVQNGGCAQVQFVATER